jgi:hypothetical protein
MKKILMTFLMSIIAFMAISQCETPPTINGTSGIVGASEGAILINGVPCSRQGMSSNYDCGTFEINLQTDTYVITDGECEWVVIDGQFENPLSCIVNPSLCDLLPVEITIFSGRRDLERIRIDWETVTEIDNDGFEVQRSEDGINFEKIGWVDGNGSSTLTHNYTFYDEEPLQGSNYYRLKQIDYNGDFEYTGIISVLFKSDKSKYEIFDLMGSKIDQMITFGIYIKKYIDGTIEFILK